MLAALVEPWVRANPAVKPKELVARLTSDYGITVNYAKALRAKDVAKATVFGDSDSSFEILEAVLDAIQEADDGNIVVLEKDAGHEQPEEDDHASESKQDQPLRFKRLFVGLAAAAHAYKHQPKISAWDGAHLRCRVSGTLLVATARDANGKLYIVAWAVVEGNESDVHWEWFARHVAELLGLTEPNSGLLHTITSDRKLVAGLEAVFGDFDNIYLLWCVRHLVSNMLSSCGASKQAAGYVWAMAKASEPLQCLTKEQEFKAACPRHYEYMAEIPKEKWCISHMEVTAWRTSTNNNAENTNGVLVEARECPVAELCLRMYNICVERWVKRREEEKKFTHPTLVPLAYEEFKREQDLSVGYVSRQSNVAGQVLVDHRASGKSRIVTWFPQIDQGVCPCLRGFQMGNICRHTYIAAQSKQVNPLTLVEQVLTRQNYVEAYNHPLPFLEVPDQWPRTALLPPPFHRKPGRPRKRRRPNNMDFGRRARRPVRCRNCKQTGHFAKTCQNAPPSNSSDDDQ